MKLRDIKELSVNELKDKIQEKAEELANLRFQHALHQLDNKAKVRITRREFAQLKTILREYELGKNVLKTKTDSGEI